MRTFSGADEFAKLTDTVTDAYKKLFPVEKNGHRIEASRIWLDDKETDPHDYTDQKKVKLAGGTWGVPVMASLTLKDPDGKVVDRIEKIRIATVPRLTPRRSYIVQGNEYQVSNQMIRKPGSYVVPSQKGDTYKGMIALGGAGQKNFDIQFDPENNTYAVEMGQAKLPLFPLLKSLGATDKELETALGEDVFKANKNKERDQHYLKMAEKLTRTSTDNKQTASEAIAAFAKTTKVDPDVTGITLGKKYEGLSKGLILDTAKKLLGVYRGEQAADDPENLVFKEIRSVEDMLHDRLSGPKERQAMQNMLTRHLGRKTELKKMIDFRKLTAPVETFFVSDNRTSTPEQYNPVHMMAESSKMTIHGTGGVESEHAVTTNLREVHPSHIGFIDPIHTPESSKIGTVLHLAAGVEKNGREINATVFNLQTAKPERLTPKELYYKTVAFPDEFVDGKFRNPSAVRVQNQGKVLTVPASKVDAILPSPIGMFSHSSNLIPFLKNNQGARGAMASKMLGQALPLVDREAPLVQTELSKGKTFHQAIGNEFVIRAPKDGIIKAVTSDYIQINEEKIPIYNNFPLNQKTHLHHEAVVKVGDRVKEGQLLADSNFTKNGELALGKNLRVAYLPIPGHTFEDGIVITESAAKKLSAEQTHKHTFQKEEGRSIVDLKKWVAFYGAKLGKEAYQNLDSDGVIKKGTTVKPGDVMIAGLSDNSHSPENMTLRKLNKSLMIPWADSSVAYKGEFPGVVTDVVKRADGIHVYVKSIEAAREADKLSGVHGNKGVISKVIPDHEAPRNAQGEIPDVFLNPHGIISRINPGQLYESAAGKLAKKTGEKYVVRNFEAGASNRKITEELKRAGISDTETLYDPKGNKLGDVHVGNPYILRLAKTGKSGFSARIPGTGYDNNLQPLKGGEEGTKTLDPLTFYSMLSHGAKKNLIDAHQKSERNDEYWHAIETGKPVPAPQEAFAFKKFTSLLKGAGVNVTKKGSDFSLSPMTDEEVKKLSRGEVTDPRFFYGKNQKEIQGGFFDVGASGGVEGKNYMHIKLHEPMPNPVFEAAIKSLTGLKGTEYSAIVAGQMKTKDGLTGGKAIAELLNKIDVDSEFTKSKSALRKLADSGADSNAIDNANKRVRYLAALKDLNMKPAEAYIRTTVPVIPPIFRPVQELQGVGRTVSPSNYLYQNIGLLSQAHDYPVMKLLADSEKEHLRGETYKATRALAGLEPVTIRGKDQPIEGFISQISGDSPKKGFFLNKLITKKQDLVSRGVVTNGPDLHVDQLGIPEKMAWSIFRPFILREFVTSGFKPEEARKEVDEQTPRAHKFLEAVMQKRTVLLNRAPSLHKFSVMAFKPQLTSGMAIKVPPLVFKGLNMDIDGDYQINSITYVISDELELNLTLTKGKDWIETRKMAARFKEKIPLLRDKTVIVCNLEDTPRDIFQGTSNATNGPIHFYTAPKGLQVIAWDELRAELVLAEVSHWSEHVDREIEIVDLLSGRQIITDNDPRAVYGIPAGTLTIGRFTPEQAVSARTLVPRVANANTDCATITEVSTEEFTTNSLCTNQLKDSISLDFNFGYYVGAMCGNGWVDVYPDGGPSKVNFAATTVEVYEKVNSVVQLLLDDPNCMPHSRERESEGYGERSLKHCYGSKEMARFTLPLIGHGADNKHLPPFFFNAPAEFKKGMLAGLIDTDGTIQLGKAEAKNKPQLMVSYSTNSIRLAQEISLLARSMGIKNGIVDSKTPLGKPCWALNFSNMDFKKVMKPEYIQHPWKKKNLEEGVVEMSPALSRHDVIPIPTTISKIIRTKVGCPRDADDARKCTYQKIHKAIKEGRITRDSAAAIITYVGREYVETLPEGKEWLAIFDNKAVTWDVVVSFKRTGIRETGYDLTVPGYETFMALDGTILSNTATLHIPVSDEAVKESLAMMPSNNLWKPGTGELMMVPSQEAAIGIYFLSQTPEGRKQINAILPKTFHVEQKLDAKKAKDLFNRIAKEEPSQFASLVGQVKALGDKNAYDIGFTASLKDLMIDNKVRDSLFAKVDKAVAVLKSREKAGPALDEKISNLYEAAAKESYEQSAKKQLSDKGSNFYHMVQSGARGNNSQLQQMVSAPGILLDSHNRKVPVPVKNSYAEGLTTSDYFISSYGVRKGMMDRALQTSKPGALNKDIMATSVDNVVTEEDCGTEKGVTLAVDRQSDLYERYLAKDQAGFKRNTLVTPQVISSMKSKGLKEVTVRTPLGCLAKKGTCAHCFGIDEHDQRVSVGDNIGTKMGQAMSEPVTQFVMRTFHTGGVAGSKSVSGFDRVNQLLSMPKYVAGAAAIAPAAGKISKIENTTAGGAVFHIGEEKITSRPGLALKVKVGDSVSAGDVLTEGVVRPQDIAKHKGMEKAQNYIVDELQKTYGQQGVQMHRKVFETVVRSLANNTRVIEAPRGSTLLPGDLIPYTVAKHYNENRRENLHVDDAAGYTLEHPIGKLPAMHEITDKDIDYLKTQGIRNKIDVLKDPLKHAPVLKSIRELPMLRKDWMAQFGYQKIKTGLTEGAAQNWKSNVEGTNPVPAFAYGASFGKKKEHY